MNEPKLNRGFGFISDQELIIRMAREVKKKKRKEARLKKREAWIKEHRKGI